jgi:predicted esterase
VPTGIPEESILQEAQGWLARVRPPELPWNGRVILLIHGWTGDENSMWFFARKLPVHSWIVSPRGPLDCPDGGYAWGIATKGERPDVQKFIAQADELMNRIPDWVPDFSPDTRLDIIGFSQGAAMTYSMCLRANPIKVAPLAGYLPVGYLDSSLNRDFSGLKMFISHNDDDNMVPIDESRKAGDLFTSRGATVQFSEGTGGHKLSAIGLRDLNAFMRD